MERKITKLEHSHVEVLVTADKETWKKAQDKAFHKQAQNITVSGFRKGKAPDEVVRKHVDSSKLLDDALNDVLQDAYRKVIEEDKIIPQAQPQVEILKASDEELEFKFVIATAPEVKLGEYKGLKINHQDVSVSEEEINAAVEDVLKNNASLVLKDSESKLGDTVVIDFAGSINGELFEGGSAENYELELGSKSFIPGFEEQLVGHKAGDHVSVNVKFPENYVEDLKGKDAVFECDIHEVKEKKLPELTDDFVKELKLPQVETIAQLRERKQKELTDQKEQQEKSRYMNALLDEIVNKSELDLADEIIEQQIKSRQEDLEQRMAQSGITVEQYLQIIGQTQEQFHDQLKVDAEKDLRRHYVVNAISEKEDLVVTDADLEFEFAKLAEQYGMKIEDVKKALSSQLGAFKNELASRKVEEFLLANNK